MLLFYELLDSIGPTENLSTSQLKNSLVYDKCLLNIITTANCEFLCTEDNLMKKTTLHGTLRNMTKDISKTDDSVLLNMFFFWGELMSKLHFLVKKSNKTGYTSLFL